MAKNEHALNHNVYSKTFDEYDNMPIYTYCDFTY